jgi:hypothetical protein
MPTITAFASMCAKPSSPTLPPGIASKKPSKAPTKTPCGNHLSGTTSAPFEAGDHRQIAVKVIDDRGNELLVVKELKA